MWVSPIADVRAADQEVFIPRSKIEIKNEGEERVF